MKWTAADIPELSGRLAVVTGANAGIGFENARILAQKGARVVLACRDPGRGEAAAERIRALEPTGTVELGRLDLFDLGSVRTFAASIGDPVDLLINNAGIMVPPLSRSAEGFESQLAVNFLGHFALTGLLLDRLEAAVAPRVVTVSSLAHRGGRIDFDRLRGERYWAWREYKQSKLADLMFAIELERRLRKAGCKTISTAAHPGVTKSDLQRHSRLIDLAARLFAMGAAAGSLPSLRAAFDAEGGSYWGPRGINEMWGAPAPARIDRRAKDPEVAAKLWALAEEATGVRWLGDG